MATDGIGRGRRDVDRGRDPDAARSPIQVPEQRADTINSFASSVSHEFKTPLASIRGSVELLRDHFEQMSSEEREGFLRNLDQDAERLDLLLRRLIDLARADVIQPEDASADVRSVLTRVAGRYSALNPVVTHGPGVTRVRMADETLESVLRNLLDNAVQHGGPGLAVALESGRFAEQVELRVADNGQGISPANLSRVFDRFFTTARETGGSGLGLSIVKALVSAHGGTIQVSSDGAGTVFRVRLPGAAKAE